MGLVVKKNAGFVHWLLLSIGGVILLGFIGFTYTLYYYDAPGPLPDQQTVVFKKGEGFLAIVDDLGKHGVIRHPLLFKAIAVVQGDARKFKAGEYDFSAAISPRLVMNMIAEGRVVVHKLSVPEGFTVSAVAELLKNEKILEGDITQLPPEGSLLPETYHFVYGDSRQEMMARMEAGMKSALVELWAKRQEGLPLTSPEQAVTLASIVERETGVNTERARVAAVFVNRLKLGMKLQSDPTVIYGIEKDKGPLNRLLVGSDLGYDSPYNTYKVIGLPPGPIANPGRAALEAVLHPADTKDIYFVATGTGGHNFSSTLSEHNKNVGEYRKLVKQQKKPPQKQ